MTFLSATVHVQAPVYMVQVLLFQVLGLDPLCQRHTHMVFVVRMREKYKKSSPKRRENSRGSVERVFIFTQTHFEATAKISVGLRDYQNDRARSTQSTVSSTVRASAKLINVVPSIYACTVCIVYYSW